MSVKRKASLKSAGVGMTYYFFFWKQGERCYAKKNTVKWNGRVFAHTSENNHGITLSIFYFATVLESSFVYLSSYYSSLIIPAPTRGGKKVPYLSLVQKKNKQNKKLTDVCIY